MVEEAGVSSKYDYLVKVKIIGDSAVGKSSIVMRFVDDKFSESMAPTIGNLLTYTCLGVDYKSKIF